MPTLGTSVNEEMTGRETRRSLVMATWTARHRYIPLFAFAAFTTFRAYSVNHPVNDNFSC